MNKEFPRHDSVAAAASAGCVNCAAALDPATLVDAYPPGRGQFAMTCGACRMSTFFDLGDTQADDASLVRAVDQIAHAATARIVAIWERKGAEAPAGAPFPFRPGTAARAAWARGNASKGTAA